MNKAVSMASSQSQRQTKKKAQMQRKKTSAPVNFQAIPMVSVDSSDFLDEATLRSRMEDLESGKPVSGDAEKGRASVAGSVARKGMGIVSTIICWILFGWLLIWFCVAAGAYLLYLWRNGKLSVAGLKNLFSGVSGAVSQKAADVNAVNGHNNAEDAEFDVSSLMEMDFATMRSKLYAKASTLASGSWQNVVKKAANSAKCFIDRQAESSFKPRKTRVSCIV
jgi:hypothetical protein